MPLVQELKATDVRRIDEMHVLPGVMSDSMAVHAGCMKMPTLWQSRLPAPWLPPAQF